MTIGTQYNKILVWKRFFTNLKFEPLHINICKRSNFEFVKRSFWHLNLDTVCLWQWRQNCIHFTWRIYNKRKISLNDVTVNVITMAANVFDIVDLGMTEDRSHNSLLKKWDTGCLYDQFRYNGLDECGVFGLCRNKRKQTKQRFVHYRLYMYFKLQECFIILNIKLCLMKDILEELLSRLYAVSYKVRSPYVDP